MARDRSFLLRILAVLAASLLLLAACGGDDADTEPTGSDNGADAGADDGDDGGGGITATTQVTALDNSFNPESFVAPAGREVTVEVTNNGQNPHTFTIDDPAADSSTIAAGESASVTFTMPDESVTFYCAIHGESVMSGTIEPS